MDITEFKKNWAADNNGAPLNSEQVKIYTSVIPSDRQLKQYENPFYCFFHFGMNTSTGREWGTSGETPQDFKIKSVNTDQWARVVKELGAGGIILTCKHHDGFCLWPSKYTDFSVKNTEFGGDIVKMLSDSCKKFGLKFGIYLSPWDMHEKTYATPEYDDYFCNQLTELLTNYGEIFEVWFDGAKGASAKPFEYDWQRYYDLIRLLQPKANIAICGPDIRWVGNEAGKSRKSEFSVVPKYLADCEKTAKNSQQGVADASRLKRVNSSDEDLGSRKLLESADEICWYPAEVDVSIRKGWFYNKKDNFTVKSVSKLMKIYRESVGNNCFLLLNIPPSDKGVICRKDVRRLKKLSRAIKSITDNPIFEQSFGMLDESNPVPVFNFSGPQKIKHIILEEDLLYSQRVEAFEIYAKKSNGKYKRVFKGTVIGNKKIIKLKNCTTDSVALVIRQSRSNPVIKHIGFYN